MQFRKITIEGKSVTQVLRVCKCGDEKWVKYSSTSLLKLCAKCAINKLRHSDSRASTEAVPQCTPEQEAAMIDNFYKNSKPSATFQDEAANHERFNKIQDEIIKNKIKEEELRLKEYQESKVEVKKEEVVVDVKKNGSEMSIDNLRIHLLNYERQFKNKKEAVAHYTQEINKEFERLGYEKRDELVVDLTGFDSVDHYYDYHEAMKIKNNLRVA